MQNNYKRWLANFLSGRSAQVKLNGKLSRTRHIHNGVPQGSTLSPALFNLFLHDLPPRPPNIKLYSYADDLTITTKHPNITTAQTHLQAYLHDLETWLTSNEMEVSPAKSSLTLFTTYNKEHNTQPQVTLYNTPLPIQKHPKILGLTLDPSLSFKQHIESTCKTANTKTNTLKALAATDFGCHKETLHTLYKQYIRPTLSYASPAWSSNLAPTHLNSLQKQQNKALRLITGCTNSTPIDHLHHESHTLKLKDHLKIQNTNFIASATAPQHPSAHLVNPPATHRQLKKTPGQTYTQLLNSLPPPPQTKAKENTYTTTSPLNPYSRSKITTS